MGCDIHSLAVVRDEETNVVTPVVCNVTIGDKSTRLDPCNTFRNYFVFGLLTGGKVRDMGIESMNLPFKGKYPFKVNMSGDKSTDTFLQNYFDNGDCDYHSHTYVSLYDLRWLQGVIYQERIKYRMPKNEDELEYISMLENASSLIEEITNFLNSVSYNLWLNDKENKSVVELLLMFDS